MLTQQNARSDASARQGCCAVSLAELRSQLATPTDLTEGHRQRLLDLAGRLARVQALAGEHARVDFSEAAQAALAGQALVG